MSADDLKRLGQQVLIDQKDVIQKTFVMLVFTMAVYELVNPLTVMIDGIILAHSFGEYAIAAHALMTPVYNLTKLLGGLFAVGSQIICSGYVGRSQLEDARRAFTASAALLAAVAAALTALFMAYSGPIVMALGAAEDPEHLFRPAVDYFVGLSLGLPFRLGTMLLMPAAVLNGGRRRVTVTANVMIFVDVAGDMLCVYVFRGGMMGLALATSLCDLISFVIMAGSFRKKQGIRLVRVFPRFSYIKEIFSAGFLPCFTRFFSMIKSVLIIWVYIRMASVIFLASNSLIQSNIKVLFTCLAAAVGQATLSMSGMLTSERDLSGLRRMFRAAVNISFGALTAVSFAVIVLARPVVALFGGGGEIMGLTVRGLRIFALGLPFIGLKMFYIYYFQSSRNLSVEELSRNIFEHGMKKGRSEYVDVKVIVEEKDIAVRFRDSCPRFDPVERARILDNADKTKCIGLRMIFSLVKDIQYVNVINLNTLLIRIDRAGPEESGDGA